MIFFDVDGTLLNEEMLISESTKKALHTLHENGVETVIATGRSPFHVRELANELKIESFVCYNGAYVEYKGKVIFTNPISKQSLEYLTKQVENHNHALVFLSEDVCYASHDNEMVQSAIKSINYDPLEARPDFWRDNHIYQCWLHCREGEELVYEQDKLLGDVRFFRWHQVSLDVMPKGGSKALGIEALLSHAGIKKEESMAIGDGRNDIEMMNCVGMSVAMGNSHPDVIPHAQFVTKHVDEEGIAYALRKLNVIK